MKHVLIAVGLTLASSLVLAQHSEKHIQEDIQRHRAMAAAHEAMAQCLQNRRDAKACLADLQAACRGLGIGRYCGMRHVH